MNKPNIQKYVDHAQYFLYIDGKLCWGYKVDGIHPVVNDYDDTDGYRQFSFKRKTFKVHRMVYLLCKGHLPNMLDHINRVRHDNRIENLRRTASFENSWNRDISPLNTSGVKGVIWSKDHKKWMARITCKKKRIFVGYFDDIKDAESALSKERKALHYDHKD